MLTLKSIFVDAFPASPTRSDIYQGFSTWVEEVAQVIPAATQWVDGSYVTTKLDPEDVDVVTFCDGTFLDALDPVTEAHIEELVNGQEGTVPLYGTHSILVGVYPKGHPRFPVYEAERIYWRKWWGEFYPTKANSDGPPVGEPKGFLQMYMGCGAKVPNISTVKGEF